MDCVVNPLLSAFFNVAARNIALVLSRREVGKELTLKMVKELKKKIETQVVKYKKNDDEDASTWTCECCKSC